MPNVLAEVMELNTRMQEIENLKEAANFEELQFSKQRRKYEEISKMLLNCDIKAFAQEEESLDEKKTKQLLSEILFEIFPEQNIKDFLDKIAVDTSIPSSIYDCVTVMDQNDKLESILIYCYGFLTIVPNLGHEFIHATFEQMPTIDLMKKYSNFHYKEVASITTEMIVAKKAETKLNLPFQEAMTNTRISHLKRLHEILEGMNKEPQLIKQNKVLRDTFIYQQHSTYQYTISDIYATNLFHYYEHDKELFLKLFKSMLNGESTIFNLLNYYHISLSNPETVQQYKKKIRNVSN